MTNQTFQGTLKEFSDKLKADYLVVQGLVKYLELSGKAVQIGKQKKDGKGRSSIIWEIKMPVILFENMPSV